MAKEPVVLDYSRPAGRSVFRRVLAISVLCLVVCALRSTGSCYGISTPTAVDGLQGAQPPDNPPMQRAGGSGTFNSVVGVCRPLIGLTLCRTRHPSSKRFRGTGRLSTRWRVARRTGYVRSAGPSCRATVAVLGTRGTAPVAAGASTRTSHALTVVLSGYGLVSSGVSATAAAKQFTVRHNQPLLWTGPRRVWYALLVRRWLRASRCPPQNVIRYAALHAPMANGKHGDHPLTDILIHDLPVYGPEADHLIRAIPQLSSRREIDEWWDRSIGWKGSPGVALREAQLEHARLLRRAKDSGWEIPGGAA